MSNFALFPSFYEDELLYSLLARYHVRSGNISYTQTAEELFPNVDIRPDIRFISQMRREAIEVMTRCMSLETIVKEHTMFLEFGRFLPKKACK